MFLKFLILSIAVIIVSPGADAKAHHGKPGHKIAHKGKHTRVSTRRVAETAPARFINTGTLSPDSLIDFAKTNIGTPYLYASTNPKKGFDCSGFVTYVFNHFGITVPRGSADYAGVQHPVALEDARPGDLIFFTGTNKHIRRIGHMGIIVKGFTDMLEFIHSSSGDAHGVTITPLNSRYMARLIKIIRIFPQENTEYSAD